MADGSMKPIELIEAGDEILTRENEWSSDLVSARVSRTVRHEVGRYLWVNDELGVTEEHVVFVNGKWQLAGDIEVGDWLLGRDGERIWVESVEELQSKTPVYNFEVEEKHSYFANGVYVHNDKDGARENFKDTAFFTVVQTDAQGRAKLTFTLPDNITEWRVSAAAVSGGNDIYAGFGSTGLIVSQDFFINPVLNTEYLLEDQPSLPVRAYGDALKSGAAVGFSLKVASLKHAVEVQGVAYESAYLSLPALSLGRHIAEFAGESGSLKDAVRLPFEVKRSHMMMPQVEDFILKNDMSLAGSATERTQVRFLNNEVGMIYGLLVSAAQSQNDRADEALSRTVATEWLNEYFEEDYTVPEYPNFVYQSGDSIALLPYADGSLELSVQMAALGSEHLNSLALQHYFEGIFGSSERTLNEKIWALRGLAALDQPYLTELNYFVSHFELEDADKMQAALAYVEFGQEAKATELFESLLNVNDQSAAWAAQLAQIAERIDSDRSEALWGQALKGEQDQSTFILLDQMLYAEARLERGAHSTVSFKLNGKRVQLKDDAMFNRSFLPTELENLRLSDVNGEVRAIVSYPMPVDLTTLSKDNRLGIRREFRVNGQVVQSLKPGDKVEVHIQVSIPAGLRDDSYQITDYLPSGLKAVTSPYAWYDSYNIRAYRNPYLQDGQAQHFYIFCAQGKCYGTDFYYLARVINKGQFVTEPAMVRSYQDLELLNISGDRDTLIIE
jgi:hypothetical protein